MKTDFIFLVGICRFQYPASSNSSNQNITFQKILTPHNSKVISKDRKFICTVSLINDMKLKVEGKIEKKFD